MAEEVVQEEREGEQTEEWIIKRPPRAKLTAEESLKRMVDFPKRRDKFIAAVRKSKS